MPRKCRCGGTYRRVIYSDPRYFNPVGGKDYAEFRCMDCRKVVKQRLRKSTKEVE